MYQEFYRNSVLLHLPLFTLIFFVIFFVCTVAWIFLVKRKDDRFERMAQLPLAAESAGGIGDE